MIFKRASKAIASLALSAVLAMPAVADSDTDLNAQQQAEALLKTTEQAARQTEQQNKQREQGFAKSEAELQAQLDALLARQQTLETETEQLSAQFSANEQRLAELEQKLQLETGSLGELFGVVRQAARELQVEVHDAITSIERPEQSQLLDEIVAARALPSMVQLEGLWQLFEQQIEASQQLSRVWVVVANGSGELSKDRAYRLGSFALIGQQGLLDWDANQQIAKVLPRQPQSWPKQAELEQVTQQPMSMTLDPSRGELLRQLGDTPTLQDRVRQGGVVGKIILALLASGLLIAGYRGVRLLVARRQISQQLKTPEQPGNNPLGRVLKVYHEEQAPNVEALELRLLEAVMDEQQSLERGLSMLKLMAALAPMLGLLGTVTGMIDTFQVITQFGNADPRVMAGGISMALITTVLGLVAAMPLLLAHNLLSSQAEGVRSILEKQGIGLVAARAEQGLRGEHELDAVQSQEATA